MRNNIFSRSALPLATEGTQEFLDVILSNSFQEIETTNTHLFPSTDLVSDVNDPFGLR